MIQHASMTLNLNALIAAILDVCSGQTSITELDEELSSILILKNEEIKLRMIGIVNWDLADAFMRMMDAAW